MADDVRAKRCAHIWGIALSRFWQCNQILEASTFLLLLLPCHVASRIFSSTESNCSGIYSRASLTLHWYLKTLMACPKGLCFFFRDFSPDFQVVLFTFSHERKRKVSFGFTQPIFAFRQEFVKFKRVCLFSAF